MNARRAMPKRPLVSLFLAIFASMVVLIGWRRMEMNAAIERQRAESKAALDEAKAERAELRGDIGKIADGAAQLARHLARLEGTVAGALAIAAPRPADTPERAR